MAQTGPLVPESSLFGGEEEGTPIRTLIAVLFPMSSRRTG